MTLFHFGSDDTSNGFSVVIKNDNGSYKIGVTYRAGGVWTELGSLVWQLIDTSKSYMILFSYDYSGSNKNVYFKVTEYTVDKNRKIRK